ncbi:MAG: hypothetical protein L0387_22430 [Acidobacteria bacterium]|nr:hypothetical protein [Acidobacteriota bacterium]
MRQESEGGANAAAPVVTVKPPIIACESAYDRIAFDPLKRIREMPVAVMLCLADFSQYFGRTLLVGGTEVVNKAGLDGQRPARHASIVNTVAQRCQRDDLLSGNSAIELKAKLKRKTGRPPMKRIIFVSFLLIVLPALHDLEAKSWGRIGAARGFGRSGHPGGRFLGFGVPGQFASGYGVQRFCHPGFRFGPVFHGHRFGYPGLGFGNYAPFHTYGGYFSSADYGISLSSSLPHVHNDSQLYPSGGNTAQPNPKTNCKDGRADGRHTSSLDSVIRLAFQRQCENAHPTTGLLPQEDIGIEPSN